MPRFRCVKCLPPPRGFEFEADYPQCPQCGGVMQLLRLIDVHLIVMSQAGPILGIEGRQHVACQPKRDGLARHPADTFAATPDPREVTCPSCKGTPAYRDMAKLFPEIEAVERMDRAAKEILRPRP